MSKLEVRLLGGFEVRLQDRVVQNFESQKVRGLFAYLVCHRRQALTRERLATLLWSERPEEAARRNLRQALHNLRSVFASFGDPDEIFLVSPTDLRIHPALDCWTDTEHFDLAAQRGFRAEGPDPYQLSTAARLYSGDFLAGFLVKDSPSFEEWIVAEQERLRGLAVEAYGVLIEYYLERGESHLGIQHARRLLAIDPLSEEAHRQMMKLCALSGRRTSALAQYEKLRNLLQAELAVEPVEETTELYRSILAQEDSNSPEALKEDPVGPLIPLVGRHNAYQELQLHWQQVLEGRGRLTLVAGETGVGKSRLIKSFTDAVTSQRRVVVLRGRACESAPPIGYGPFTEVVVCAFAEFLPEEREALLRRLRPESAVDLACVAPAAIEGVTKPAGPPRETRDPRPSRFADSMFELLDLLSVHPDDAARPSPVIVLMDDVQCFDKASLDLLSALLPQISKRRIWILATSRREALAGVSFEPESGTVDRVSLGRLGPEEIEEVSIALVGSRGAKQLSDFLARWSEGLPLALAELINYLWDEGILTPDGRGRWLIRDEIESIRPPSGNVRELIQYRIRRLPTSARRLLSIAAIIGQRFDADLMQFADGEHPEVVEVCIQLMLERWLIRQSPASWQEAGRDQDIVLWVRGVRRGIFEFAHEEIRTAVLEEINPIRKQAMHRAVARALRYSRGGDLASICEKLAHHDTAAGDWQNALPCLESAAHRAAAVGATEIARSYCERSLQTIERLVQEAANASARQELDDKQRKMLQFMNQITACQTA